MPRQGLRAVVQPLGATTRARARGRAAWARTHVPGAAVCSRQTVTAGRRRCYSDAALFDSAGRARGSRAGAIMKSTREDLIVVVGGATLHLGSEIGGQGGEERGDGDRA